jgi:thiol-disulfide isomerase/thioredoxin
MKFRTTLTIILVVLLLGINNHTAISAGDLSSTANIQMYPKPMEMNELILKNTAGKDVSLQNFKGKVVLLHFWSIECPACKMEEPLLDQLKRTVGPAGLEILAVNLTDPPPMVAQYALTHNIPYPVLVDAGNGFSLQIVNMGGKNTAFVINPKKEAILAIPAFPTTYILDCRGSAVGYSVGVARWDDSTALSFLKSLVSDKKTCALRS